VNLVTSISYHLDTISNSPKACNTQQHGFKTDSQNKILILVFGPTEVYDETLAIL
jgi:hypothetical protein